MLDKLIDKPLKTHRKVCISTKIVVNERGLMNLMSLCIFEPEFHKM